MIVRPADGSQLTEFLQAFSKGETGKMCVPHQAIAALLAARMGMRMRRTSGRCLPPLLPY